MLELDKNCSRIKGPLYRALSICLKYQWPALIDVVFESPPFQNLSGKMDDEANYSIFLDWLIYLDNAWVHCHFWHFPLQRDRLTLELAIQLLVGSFPWGTVRSYNCLNFVSLHIVNRRIESEYKYQSNESHKYLDIAGWRNQQLNLKPALSALTLTSFFRGRKGWLPIAKLKKIQVRIIQFGCNLGQLIAYLCRLQNPAYTQIRQC